jgi:SSS family solute:Na+ symporter
MLVPFSVGMFPHLFQHWLTAKSANSFKLPVVAHPIFIMIVWVPCVLVGVWATTDLAGVPSQVSANGVLSFLVKAKTNDVLAGFLTAGILAAIMSSLDSQFLCIGSIFTNDVVLHYAGKDRFTDKQIVVIARSFVIGIVAVTYFLSLLGNPRVFALGVWCFSGFSSLFPLVFASVYWRRLTKAGAYASILTAAVTWVVLFYQSGFAKNADYTVDFTLGGQSYETMPVATMVLASTVALVVVSLVTPVPSEATINKFFKPAK